MGQVAGQVTLEVVLKVADGISLIRTQRLGQKYMRDLLTSRTHQRRGVIYKWY